MKTAIEGAPHALAYQPQHRWSDGTFDMWTNIGPPTISKRVVWARLTVFRALHPDDKLRVLKVVSSAEVIDSAEFLK